MRARIFQPARTAMSSGTAKSKAWILERAHSASQDIDPLMRWTSSGETQTQVRLTFDSKQAALDYAKSRGIEPGSRMSFRKFADLGQRSIDEATTIPPCTGPSASPRSRFSGRLRR